MERREVEARLSQEVGRITAETTLVPVTEAGQIRGFALTRVPEGTLLTDVGLRPGDVLQSINGTPIDSLATLMSLWTRLQGESSLRAELVRNGQPLSLELTLR
jgi:general secretion pathway protein C